MTDEKFKSKIQYIINSNFHTSIEYEFNVDDLNSSLSFNPDVDAMVRILFSQLEIRFIKIETYRLFNYGIGITQTRKTVFQMIVDNDGQIDFGFIEKILLNWRCFIH